MEKFSTSDIACMLKDFSCCAADACLDTVLLTHAFPIVRGVMNEQNEKGLTLDRRLTMPENLGSYFGFFSSIALQLATYSYISNKGYPEAWLIPVATNLLSKGLEYLNKINNQDW